ncbi:MAG: sigma-70 family RNA polymerase sigma factor [Planctomycetes bacterium]|nr:sigma-70 family RNA polymerase sigma factor [Planctomycetota bacterium]
MAGSAEFVAQVTRVQRPLHAFILSLVWNPTDAEEVLQETNLTLWEKADEFDASRPFLPWAMRFAQWQAMAWLKKRQRQRLVIDDDLAKLLADEATQEEAESDARRVALAACLQKLGTEQRKLIAKRYEPDGSVNAMAEEAGITPKAVSDRLRRIRQALLECIRKTVAEEALA